MSEWLGVLSQNSPETILSAGGVFVSLVAVTIVIRYVAVRYLTAYAARTQTRVDDVFLLLVKKANTFIIILLAAFLAQKVLFVPEKLAQIFRLVAISGAFLQLALWGNATITFFLTEATRRTDQQDINISARRAIAYFSRIILWLLVITLLLENLGVRLSPLLAGIGIGGVAVALAIQNILGDLFCYVAMILDKPFVAGDFLVIGDMMGTVERIGLKTTRIRSLSGELLIFANHDLADSRVRNYKSLRERRVVFKFGVTYETPIEKLKTIPSLVTSVFEAVPECRLDRVHFAQLGDFSLNFEVVYYVLSGDYTTYMNLQQEINLRLMQVLGKEDIDFAYPTQTLYVHAGARSSG